MVISLESSLNTTLSLSTSEYIPTRFVLKTCAFNWLAGVHGQCIAAAGTTSSPRESESCLALFVDSCLKELEKQAYAMSRTRACMH